MNLLEVGFDGLRIKLGKTTFGMWLAELWITNLWKGRIDAAGWPTRDAAAPQEDC